MINNVTLLGRLTRDPDLRYLPGGKNTAVVTFTLAVDRGLSREKKQEAEQRGWPTADFIRCKAWGGRAETISQYVGKGDQLAVAGRIETGRYENNNGDTVYTTDVVITDFSFVGGYSDTKNTNHSGNNNNSYGDDFDNDFEMIEMNSDEIPF